MRMRLMAAALVAAVVAVPLAAQQPAKTVETPPGGYTPAQLVETLTKLGYEPTVYGAKKDKCWISLNRGNYSTTVAFEISSDATTIWFDCPLTAIANPAQAPNKAMQRLLEENDKIGPAHYTYDIGQKRFHLYRAHGNHDWTPKKLRQEIEQFDDTLRKQEPNWRIDNFLRLSAVPEAVEKKELALLEGTWKLVEGRNSGVVSTPEQLAKANVIVTIKGNKLSAVTDGKTQEWTITLDPTRTLKAADFVLTASDRVEAGIYKLEGDRLTIHLSAIGVERPLSFDIPEGDKRSVLVLVRQKP
jgi:uncharacterized protein (TIGR03067 family)